MSDAERAAIVVPEPVAAFAASSQFFLDSADRRTGSERGLSLKGHIEAEVWKQIAGGKPAPDLAAQVQEAKRLPER